MTIEAMVMHNSRTVECTISYPQPKLEFYEVQVETKVFGTLTAHRDNIIWSGEKPPHLVTSV